MAGVTFRGLSKAFGTVLAVDDVSFEIRDGEFVCLLGPSGCGKTTTLRLIAGLEQPSSGTIHIGERDVTAVPPKGRDVGMVFQDYALYPHMTILDNIGYPLKVRGVASDERAARVREVAQNLQIGTLLERRPAQISGGQQQRTSVARAVVHKPQVFLFDEPLSNLDAKLRLEARSFLKHLQRELGVTAVYVTHDQAEAMALADRIAVMQDGRVVQMAPPLEVYRRPATTFVANFLGSPPMNLLKLQLRRSGTLRLEADSISLPLEGAVATRLADAFAEDADVTLGIRPEHVQLAAEAGPWTLAGDLYAVESLGPESLVTLRIAEDLLTVRIFSDDPPELGERVFARLDARRVHVFRDGGERVDVT